VNQTALTHQAFPGASENAIETQLWRTVAPYVFIIVKKALGLQASLSACLQVLSVSVFDDPNSKGFSAR
jgi:hypothetical protein